jgi:Protein of unknown function (DUF1153)
MHVPATYVNKAAQPAAQYVIGPDGRRLTLADLPSPNTRRWVMRRKAEVIAAVRGGMLSPEEASRRYALHYDELLSWLRRLELFGFAGLRTTRTQYYRERCKRQELSIPTGSECGPCTEPRELDVCATDN